MTHEMLRSIPSAPSPADGPRLIGDPSGTVLQGVSQEQDADADSAEAVSIICSRCDLNFRAEPDPSWGPCLRALDAILHHFGFHPFRRTMAERQSD
jgi:hypothetical protein